MTITNSYGEKLIRVKCSVCAGRNRYCQTCDERGVEYITRAHALARNLRKVGLRR